MLGVAWHKRQKMGDKVTVTADDFDKDLEHIEKTIWFVWFWLLSFVVVFPAIILSVLCISVFVAYRILVFFGVL